ncbi:MAG: hypothetical protein ACLUFI_12655 [Oscillospiraceae bacterium]
MKKRSILAILLAALLALTIFTGCAAAPTPWRQTPPHRPRRILQFQI